MGKRNIAIVAVSSIILFAAIVVLWLLSGNSMTDGDDKGKSIAFIVDGQEVANLDKEFLFAQESKTFRAIIRSSGKKPQEVQYTGIPLANLIKELSIDTTNRKQIVVKAIDNFTTVLTVEELAKGQIYIAYMMDGEELKPKSQGGFGPYQLVILNDHFSQRWCKYVYQVEVK